MGTPGVSYREDIEYLGSAFVALARGGETRFSRWREAQEDSALVADGPGSPVDTIPAASRAPKTASAPRLHPRRGPGSDEQQGRLDRARKWQAAHGGTLSAAMNATTAADPLPPRFDPRGPSAEEQKGHLERARKWQNQHGGPLHVAMSATAGTTR